MEFSITGRHVEITQAIKNYAEKKLGKLENYFDFKENGEIHIIVTVEKYRHTAEGTIRSKRHEFSAKVESKDMYSSLDLLEDKLISQVKKQKEKVKKEGKTRARKSENLEKFSSINEEGEFADVVEEELWAAKPMDTQEAMNEVELMPEKAMMFYNVDFKKICLIRKRKDGKYGISISK